MQVSGVKQLIVSSQQIFARGNEPESLWEQESTDLQKNLLCKDIGLQLIILVKEGTHADLVESIIYRWKCWKWAHLLVFTVRSLIITESHTILSS